MGEQPPLHVQPAAIAAKAVTGNDPVAWDDDGVRVGRHDFTHRPRALRIAGASAKIAIGQHGAEPNCVMKNFEHPPAEATHSIPVDRQVERRPLTGEILAKLPDALAEHTTRLSVKRRGRPATRKPYAGEARFGRRDIHGTQRRIHRSPRQRVHPHRLPTGDASTAESGSSKPCQELARRHRHGTCRDDCGPPRGRHIVVITLERPPRQTDSSGERVQLLVRLIAYNVTPVGPMAGPDGRIDEDRHPSMFAVLQRPG